MNDQNNGFNPNDPMGMNNPNPMGPTPMDPNMGMPGPTPMEPNPGMPEPNPMGPAPMDQNMAMPGPTPMEPNMGMPGPTPMDQNMMAQDAPVNPGMGMPNPGMMNPNPMMNPNMGMPNPQPGYGMNNMPEEPKKNNKLFLIIVVILGVVLAVVVALYFIGKNHKEANTPNNNTNVNTGTNDNTNTNTNNNTNVATGNTYEVSGYRLTIPEKYTVQAESDGLMLQSADGVVAIAVQIEYSYNDLVAAKDQLPAALPGFNITKDGEKTYGGRTWYVFEGSVTQNGRTADINFAFTDFKGANLQALVRSTNYEATYQDLNTIINTAQEGTASFASDPNAPMVKVNPTSIN